LAFPCIQRNAHVALAGSENTQQTQVCAVVPGDPRIAQQRLAWGRPVADDKAAEVVIGKHLLERLGGSLPTGPTAPALTVEVSRRVDGKEQVKRLVLPIVGVLATDHQEPVYLPLEEAARLDRWATGALPESGGPDATFQLGYSRCNLFVPDVDAVAGLL